MSKLPNRYGISDIYFKCFKHLDQKFLSNIKFVHIYYKDSSNDGLIVTKVDKMYAFGDNKNGLLGLGHENRRNENCLIFNPKLNH